MADEGGFRGPMQKLKWIRNGPRIIKILAVACVLLLIVCIALIIVTVVTTKKLHKAEDVCSSKECILSASRLLDNLNPSVSPCDDFYEFACGGFIKKNDPKESMSKSVLMDQQADIRVELKKLLQQPVATDDSEIATKAKNLYASCMNITNAENSMEIARNLLESVGRWPLVDDRWRDRDFDLEGALALLYVHEVKPFFQAQLIDDNQNNEDFLLNIMPGNTIMSDDFFLNDSNPDYQMYIHHYKKLIKETARLFGRNGPLVDRDVDDMLEFEKKFAELTSPIMELWQERLQDPETALDAGIRCNTSMLKEMIPQFKWDHFYSKVFDYFKIPVQKKEFTILLQNRNFFNDLTALFKRTSKRTVANYLTWSFVYKTMPYLDLHFRRLYSDFVKVVPLGEQEEIDFTRWTECMTVVLKYFHIPVTSLYMKTNFDKDKRDKVKELLSYLQNSFITGIRNQDWIDDETKDKLVLKIRKIKSHIGASKYVWKNPELLEKQYSAVNISSDGYLRNILRLIRHNVANEMHQLTGTVKREEEVIARPLDVNAYFMRSTNKLYVPLAMLRSPAFVVDRPHYINYGTLGMILGHEIGHGFDTMGFFYGPNGEIEAWKHEILMKFAKKAECFAEQYSKLPMDLIGINVDGNLTINENIPDNAGIRNGLRAYNTYVSEHGEEPKLPGLSYSAQQIYFIEFAQAWCEVGTKASYLKESTNVHTTAKHRVRTPLMNSPEFSELFQCPLGSTMNPEKKCDLWA